MALQVDLNSVMRLNVLEPSTIIHSSLALFDSRSESPLRGFLIQQPYYNDCYNVDLQEQFGIMHIFVRTWYMGNKGTIDMRDWTSSYIRQQDLGTDIQHRQLACRLYQLTGLLTDINLIVDPRVT